MNATVQLRGGTLTPEAKPHAESEGPVASGIGARHKVRMGEIDDPGPVAATLRQLVP